MWNELLVLFWSARMRAQHTKKKLIWQLHVWLNWVLGAIWASCLWYCPASHLFCFAEHHGPGLLYIVHHRSGWYHWKEKEMKMRLCFPCNIVYVFHDSAPLFPLKWILWRCNHMYYTVFKKFKFTLVECTCGIHVLTRQAITTKIFTEEASNSIVLYGAV